MGLIAVFGMGQYELAMFAIFIGMLSGLLFFHHHKNMVVAIGFALMSLLFISMKPEDAGIAHWAEHFLEPHRLHLLIDLALLIPAFALVAHYFEHSGASHGLAHILRSDLALLWTVFCLSIGLDNIAAALIGATILLAKYGKDAPFRMIVGIIGASNLGGAGSPVGDTTTVMMYISKDPKVPALELFMAFAASIPAMVALGFWAVRHGMKPQSYGPGAGPKGDVIEEKDVLRKAAHSDIPEAVALADLAKGDTSVRWKDMWPLLAIPGLIGGNILGGMPGVGVWVGLLAGLFIARIAFKRKVFMEAIPNMLFLVTLVGAAEMLPLYAVKDDLERIPAILGLSPRDVVAVLMGKLSPWFDNIPLTAICLQLKGFDWGLLAYCVGFGGSAMWFGSSAGVAIGLIFPQTYNTKKWLVPFFVITGAYWVGVISYEVLAPHIAPLMIRDFVGQGS